MRKAQVRALAEELALPVADKADSQDLCFVPAGRYASIVERLKPGAMTPGDIVHVDGRWLGRHDGIINFTIGQRRGLKVAGHDPLFVVRLDAQRNEVVVGPRESLATKTLALRDVNWLGDEPLALAAAGGLPIYARVRSSQPPQPATLHADADGDAFVVLETPENGVAAGQACVFYANGAVSARVLGGGFIARTLAPGIVQPESLPASPGWGKLHPGL
jgi:tRNA-specific 2-thiouridylase